ncbi:uncharacterized protein LOC135137388 [Zophobas morio]|uniref:uncharacterized protein LOC135137388 n=1 Tax=Zophobas morio TaxID=2755281 RepID=UPI003082A7A5
MAKAIDAVTKKEMGWLKASKSFGVPATTLRRRIKNQMGANKGYLGGRKTTFTPEVEEEILEHIKRLEEMFFGITRRDLRKLAYDVAERNGIAHNFSSKEQLAGWDWVKGFQSRHPTISLRIPEATSAARPRGFNKVVVSKHFENLSLMNLDYPLFRQRTPKYLQQKGESNYVPPALIFPRKRLKNELMDNSPPGSVAFAQEKGWMTGPVFLQWLDHFVKYVKPSPEDKILLILDGHGSHKSLEVLEFTKKHGIILFCLPPHTTHRLQPLDVTFYSSLTNYYNIELEKWLKNHPGRVVTHFQVASILKKAYAQATTISTAENGFYQTGIIPLNPDIIPDWMYVAAEPTNIETEKVVLSNTESDNLSSQPCSSNMADDSGNLNPEKNTLNVQERSSRGSSSLNVSVEEIYPLPKAPVETQNRTQRRKGKSGIINATPEIVEAKRLHAEKEAKSLRTAGKKASKNLKNVFEPNESDNSEDDPYETDDEYGDTVCIYCNELLCWSLIEDKAIYL